MATVYHSPCQPKLGTTALAIWATSSWAKDTQMTQMPLGRPRFSGVKFAEMTATLTMERHP